MRTKTAITKLSVFLAAALLTTACSEAVAPPQSTQKPFQWTPAFASVAASSSGIAFDQQNGTMGDTGRLIIKGFNPTNPHRGDAIVATFSWVGSTNIIDSVVDVLTSSPTYTPVGNKYTLVDYVTSGGYSMATYVATNVQNFPDPVDPFHGAGDILAVGAYLSESVTESAVNIVAWTGVNTVAGQSVGAHRSASGLGSGIMPAGPGSISIGAGALAYAITISNGLVGRDPPAGFGPLGVGADRVLVIENDTALQGAIGTVNPQWTWYWPDSPPSTWLATVLALNPPLHLAFTVQPKTTPPLLAIPAVKVTALDAEGNPVTSFNGSVTIAIGHNGGTLLPGTLSGTKTVTAVNGVATFSNLSIDQMGNGYTLVVSAANVFGVESAPFNIGVL